MRTHELLFELSHPVRYEITKRLSEQPLRLTRIGESVDANNPEVSRHLDRLKKARLVAKDPDGYYSMTPFGRLIQSMLPGLSFISDHPDYFMEHDLSLLPPQFICRLGELSNCSLTEGTINNLGISTKLVQDATERSDLITMEIPHDTTAYHERFDDGVEWRLIVHEDSLPQCGLGECTDPEIQKRIRFHSRLPVIMILTENEGAVMFPNHKGAFDFAAGFNSSDPVFLDWCEDLFEYLWEKGKRI